jgi:uncharacterized membrane protein YhdT
VASAAKAIYIRSVQQYVDEPFLGILGIMMSINLVKSMKYGVLMGLGFCFYTIMMWLTKLDSAYLSIGQYFDMAIIILPLAIISLGIYQQNKLNGITLLQRVFVAILIGAVSFVIYNPFLYLYHHVINPDWFNAVLALKEIELTKGGLAQDLIAAQLEVMRNSPVAQAKMFQLSSMIASVLVIPILISFITLLFIKKNNNQAN